MAVESGADVVRIDNNTDATITGDGYGYVAVRNAEFDELLIYR